jgi:hypothetical protein
MALDALTRGWSREVLLVIALAVTSLVLMRVPLIGWLFYPFELFVTYIHEICHGLAALLTGGRFVQFTVAPNGSGQALTAGGWRWAISSAGYVGSALIGGLLLIVAASRGSAQGVLFWLGVLLGIACLIWARNLFGFGVGLLMAAALMAAGLRLGVDWSGLLLLFLAVQATLGALDSLFGLIQLSTFHRGVLTDAQIMAHSTGVPAVVWSILWSGLSLTILWQALRLAYRS